MGDRSREVEPIRPLLDLKEEELGAVRRVWKGQSGSGRFWGPTDAGSWLCEVLLIVSCARPWAPAENKADLPVLTRLTAQQGRQTDRQTEVVPE